MDDDDTIEALNKMTHAIRKFAQAVDQEFTMAPALQLVLPTMRDYQAVRERLFSAGQAMTKHMQAEMTDAKHGPEIECFMYGGVEIQVICHEQAMTRMGQALGATEVGYVYLRGLPPLQSQ